MTVLSPASPDPLVTPTPPQSLLALTSATTESERERAWTAFLADYNPLILHVTRSLGGDHDTAMDRYAFVLEALRRDDCRRLRAYVADRRGKFTTWLIVVARRLCLDEHRRRYGRLQGASAASHDLHRERRNLTDLVGNELDLEDLTAAPSSSPENRVLRSELRTALEDALAALEPADRLLLRMRFEDDFSVPQIARALGKASPFPLYRRIESLLSTLRSSLNGSGVDDGDV